MGTLQQMRQELRLNLESTVEKTVMDNQMHKSKASEMSSWTKIPQQRFVFDEPP